MKQVEVAQLMDAVLAAGLLEQKELEPFRPIVQLTARGLDVMAGRDDQDLSLAVSDTLWRKIGGSTQPKTRETPRAEPPPNLEATPVERSSREGADAPSAAPRKQETQKREAQNKETQSSAPPAASPQAADRATVQPSHYWTWRLLDAGLTPSECAAARGLAEDVVLDHALRAAEKGLAIDALWFLSTEQIATIRGVVGDVPPERIRPLLGKLPRGTRYEHVQLVLKSR
jgi:hypothetical protein